MVEKTEADVLKEFRKFDYKLAVEIGILAGVIMLAFVVGKYDTIHTLEYAEQLCKVGGFVNQSGFFLP